MAPGIYIMSLNLDSATVPLFFSLMLVFLLSLISEWFHAFYFQVGEYQRGITHCPRLGGGTQALGRGSPAHLEPISAAQIYLLQFFSFFILKRLPTAHGLNSEQQFLNVEYSIIIYSITWIQQ